MSRHRNVRSMDYTDEYDGYDDVYGHSVDEDSCISPSDAQQWIYDRARGQQSISEFIATHRDIEEEDEEYERRNSESFEMPQLNDEDRARLESCMDEIRNVVGESISDRQMIETILKHKFDCAKSLDDILNNSETSKNNVSKENTSAGGSGIAAAPGGASITKEAVEKDIAVKLTEKYIKPFSTKNNLTGHSITVDKLTIKKGFEINSPNYQSPVVSGRNTPEINEDTKFQSTANASASVINKSKDQLQSVASRNGTELFQRERGHEKQHIHMVVIGHVDAGKSTLMGHTLYDLGVVSQRAMHKYEQESKKLGKQSFMYAWVLDETGEERERGITMDLGSTRFETDTKTITLLDAPGHKDFIPNMITGATQADVALLVVDATRGEFETGFEQGGQTREHALLVRSLGVSQLGVVINKLDTVNWAKERFDEIVLKLKTFLKLAGFKESEITYIPCSGLTGENLVKLPNDSELAKWYQGPSLINVIENFKTPERSINKPFRMSINDIFKGTGSGYCLSGRIETGILCTNDKILVCPLKEQAIVKTITIDDIQKSCSFAGDQISIQISGIDTANLSNGCILCDINNVIPIATRIQARIVVFNINVPITMGFPVLLHHQSLIEPATIIKLKSQLHKGTGEIIKKNPRCLGNNSCAEIILETTKPICIEKYSDYKELGRIMLRVGGVTIAAGLVTNIIK